jgi:hypothetical protein
MFITLNNKKEFTKPYQSTLEFNKFIKNEIVKCDTIIDIGSGEGGTISYYIKKYNLNFILTDYQKKYLTNAKKKIKSKKVKFKVFDCITSKPKLKISSKNFGIISQKTFNCFDDIYKPLNNLLKLNPKFIAINALFWDGFFDVKISTVLYDNNFKKFSRQINNLDRNFNIFSLKKLKNFCKKKKIKLKIKDFYPKHSIYNKKISSHLGSYTLKTGFNNHTLFSGPIHLPWKFIMLK